MDFAVVVTFVALMIGGFAVGMLLSVVRPRDDETSAMHRQQARRVRAWLAERFRSRHLRLRPAPDSGSHG